MGMRSFAAALITSHKVIEDIKRTASFGNMVSFANSDHGRLEEQ